MSAFKPLVVCGENVVTMVNGVAVNSAPKNIPVDATNIGDPTISCQFPHLILAAQNLIYDLVILATILTVVGFIYAGFKLITSGGNPGAKEAAKKVFTNILIGYIVILTAWLLVSTITKVLIKNTNFGSLL
jgi:hypothetical protein